jgi:hypothetical protein
MSKKQKQMIIFALNVVLKNYCSNNEEKQRYRDLIKEISDEK